MVDLVGAYSKRRDLADRQARTLERLHKAQAQTDEHSVSVRSTGRSQQQWQVMDRLSEADRRLLVQAFKGGTPKWKLAEQYGVSLSSVKRLLRKHRTVQTGVRS
jgi:hypothetical protein